MTTTPESAPAVPAKIEAPYTLKLERPIQHGDEKITELTFPEFQAAWMEDCPIDLSQMKMGDVLRVVARACGYPVAAIRKLGMSDLQRVSEVVAVFFDDGPATGGTT